MTHQNSNNERPRLFNRTDGCIALSNAEIEKLWKQVADGTSIMIRP
jgi:L,D-peptidoglycan transpeptidase YkuD (ErfK/YbiS/YcfS/YnhG family)